MQHPDSSPGIRVPLDVVSAYPEIGTDVVVRVVGDPEDAAEIQQVEITIAGESVALSSVDVGALPPGLWRAEVARIDQDDLVTGTLRPAHGFPDIETTPVS